MSDKFTVKELTKEIMDAHPRTIADAIAAVAQKYPERFAPEPDPVEEFIAYACQECPSRRYCEKGILNSCPGKRDALRTYVADLRKRAEGK